MSVFQDVIKDLQGLYTDLKLDESGKTARKQVTLTLDLVLYDDRDPKDWEVVDKKTKAATLVNDVTGAPKLISLEFISKFNEFVKEATKKDPIENLKDGGFEISDVPNEATEEPENKPVDVIQESLNGAEPVNKDYRKKLTPEAIQRADDYTKEHNPELWEQIKKQREERLAALDAGEIEKPEPVKPVRVPAKREKPVHTMPAVIPANMRDTQIQELTVGIIQNYICPTATDSEAFMFLKLCQARNLNPFLNEAYLIKYGNKTTMTVGKEAFMRRAEAHPQFDGYEAGIIIQNADKTLDRREGTFLLKNEVLVGGWAKIYRKDRRQPFVSEVALHEYDQKQSLWISKPATMIRKVAIVQGKREAFPSEFGGMYDTSEMGVDVMEAEYEVQA